MGKGAIKMKKQTLNIACSPGVFEISGEIFSGHGVTVFIHKVLKRSSWCISEFSTGFRIVCSGDYCPVMQQTVAKGKAGIVSAATALVSNPGWCQTIARARDYNLKHGGKIVNKEL